MALELNQLLEERNYLSTRESSDWPAVNCEQGDLLEFLKELRDTHGYVFLADVTAIDHYSQTPRFEVVYHLYNLDQGTYLRVASPCSTTEPPTCKSVVELWPTADWHERETYDMFGIEFEGHPDLRRILMWDGYPHYPLRKEFPLAGVEGDFPSEEIADRTGIKVKAAPMMGGPFHAPQTSSMSEREPRADDESWTESEQRQDIDGDGDPRELRQNH